MMKFVLLIFFTLTSSVYAQVSQEWVRNHTGSSNIGAQGVKALTDNDNNIYVLGIDYPCADIQCRDFSLIKYNQLGVEQWSVRYNGPENWREISTDMTIDQFNNIYITGYTEFPGMIKTTTIKYNSLGQQQWIAEYIPTTPIIGGNTPVAIETDNAGNIYLLVESSTSTSSRDYLTIKYNDLGQELWSVRYDLDLDYPKDLKIDGSGNVYVTGYSLVDSISRYNIKTIKYNSFGLQQWIVEKYAFMSIVNDRIINLELVNDALYIGGTAKMGLGDEDILIMKYDLNGNLLWEKAHGNIISDLFSGIIIDSQENLIVTGRINELSNGIVCNTVKYNPFGVEQYNKKYLFEGLDGKPKDLTNDSYGNVYITGYEKIQGSNNYKSFTLKYNPVGIQEWNASYSLNPESKNHNYSIVLDNENNVYTVGTSIDSIYIMTTIKYSQTTGIQTLSNELPQKFSLEQNYPNPFNPSTNIQFEIANPSHVKLVIYDALGREVSILADESMQPGSYNANFSADGLNSGIYFYSLITDSFKETKKMILLK